MTVTPIPTCLGRARNGRQRITRNALHHSTCRNLLTLTPVPCTAGFCEPISRTPQKRELDDPLVVNAVAGSMAGALTAIFVCPLDVLKTRLQVQAGNQAVYPGISGKPPKRMDAGRYSG